MKLENIELYFMAKVEYNLGCMYMHAWVRRQRERLGLDQIPPQPVNLINQLLISIRLIELYV